MLKSTTLNFVGNLTVEPILRQHISADMGGLLSLVYDIFASDVTKKSFDWIESAARTLHTINNCAIQPEAQNLISSRNFDQMSETVFKTLSVWPDRPQS